MEKYIIVADVVCDLSKGIRDMFGVEAYSGGYVHISDGREIKTELNWENISREEFYKLLSNKKIEVSSSPFSPEEYYRLFEKYVARGYKVLSMSVSAKISSTHSVTLVAAERLKKEYPDCEIYCFDSTKMSGALGLLVCHAHRLKNEGKSFGEVIEWLENNKYKVHQMGPIDDLIFIARRGRISMGKAIMGSFAGVKPMGDCNHEGYVSVMTKAKGIKKALELTVKYVERTAVDIENQFIIISHSDREDYALMLRAMLEEALHPADILVSDVFAASGTNIGPGMIGVYYLGEEASPELAKERAVMDALVKEKK